MISKNFKDANEELREQLALCCRKIATELVEIKEKDGNLTSSLEAYLACRLVPLDKSPGLRPIGIGEVIRRILGKSFMTIVKEDVQEIAGAIQVCAGQSGGCEAAIHGMKDIYDEEDTEGVLLLDARNAFNLMSRATMLENIRRTCPVVYPYAYNCYSIHVRLFVVGGVELKSKEGTTQGDPTSMALYALGLMPLLWKLNSSEETADQVGYADDLQCIRKLKMMRKYYDICSSEGPKYGFFLEGVKCYCIPKPELVDEAIRIFEGTEVKITPGGKRQLGAAIGTAEFKTEFVGEKVAKWVHQIDILSQVAAFDPHSAYVAFTSSLRHRYTYVMRTVADIGAIMQPLEDAIRYKLLPALTEGREVSDMERDLISLPPRLGGLGIINPSVLSNVEYDLSRIATSELTEAIKKQLTKLPDDFEEKTHADKQKAKMHRAGYYSGVFAEVTGQMSDVELKTNSINMEKGASNWLTTIPIGDFDFHLNKREFWDAINIRYNWPLSNLPTKCPCGASFDVDHALKCHKGGFLIQRHNELRDLTADLLAEVCKDVAVEPSLESLTGEKLKLASAISSDEARLDVSARGFWQRGQRAFFDVKVFNPNAQRHLGQTLAQCYISNEKDKKRSYCERVLEVENGTFTPLIFNCFGGMGPECRQFYKRLCGLLAEKRDDKLSMVTSWVRTKISFALLRSCLMCVRGTRHRYYKCKFSEVDIERDLEETRVEPL